MDTVLSILDLFLTPLYIIFIYIIAHIVKATQIKKHPEYKYFVYGVLFKVFGGIAFALVYVFYYDGGDTHTYFIDSKAVSNLLLANPSAGIAIISGNLSNEYLSLFNSSTGMLHGYVLRDPNTFTVIRYSSIFNLFGFQTYLPTTILVGLSSYIGIWKLFQLFQSLYPTHIKYLSIAILFMPSFAFWGSGIMKDTYIVGATCWITYNFYQIFISQKKIILNVALFIMNFIIILNIKSYVIACLVPSMLFWLNQVYIKKIKNIFFRIMLLPLVLSLFTFFGFYLYGSVGDSMGEYGSVESAINKAKITQEDLLRDNQYGSNNYDLGEIDGSFTGMLKIAPMAIFTCLYRPQINEIGGALMALSAVENISLLIFTLIIILKTKPQKMLLVLRQNPLIQYCMVFSIMFAYGVGIATANFGALVRYKIPLIPFYFTALFLIYQIAEVGKKLSALKK